MMRSTRLRLVAPAGKFLAPQLTRACRGGLLRRGAALQCLEVAGSVAVVAMPRMKSICSNRQKSSTSGVQ
jgi:hypothetical protein